MNKALYFDFSPWNMRLERLNNLPLNTVTPNFVAIFVFFGTASSFIERISFSEIEAKREAILFLFGCSEVNSTWIITSGLANQRAPKVLFTCVVCERYPYKLPFLRVFLKMLIEVGAPSSRGGMDTVDL